MLVSDMNGQADAEIDYKRKYKNLKRKLKFLVYVSIVGIKLTFNVVWVFCVCISSLSCLKFALPFPGARMLPGGAEKSTEETSQDFQGQKVNSACVDGTTGRFLVRAHANKLPLLPSFLLDRLLPYERVDEDSSGRCWTSTPAHPELLPFHSKVLLSSRLRCNCLFRK